MNSIKMLELYLFEGVPESATRHYADDIHAFDADRGTRDGINEDSQPQNKTGTNQISELDFDTIDYSFDKIRQEMILTIK